MANMSLQPALPTQDKGRLVILVQTENQCIDIPHICAPIDSTLGLTAVTTNASLESSVDIYYPELARMPVEDSAGWCRTRAIRIIQRSSGSMKGSVSTRPGRESVDARTRTNERARLVL
ncbi:hypothetical protein OF83DRAFT_424198 [Amylostereum chailletii]|nr:hypothetical protein OF83DRAFT_424198 [Amylostereum chailletii]